MQTFVFLEALSTTTTISTGESKKNAFRNVSSVYSIHKCIHCRCALFSKNCTNSNLNSTAFSFYSSYILNVVCLVSRTLLFSFAIFRPFVRSMQFDSKFYRYLEFIEQKNVIQKCTDGDFVDDDNAIRKLYLLYIYSIYLSLYLFGRTCIPIVEIT